VAAHDYFLRIDGMPGESQDAKHAGEIDVLSCTWGATNPGPVAAGGAAATAKAQLDPIAVTMRTSKASPLLFAAAAGAQRIKQAVLTARRSGAQQQDYLVVTLADVFVTAFRSAGEASGGLVDQVTLGFGRIEIEYRPQKPDGSLDAPVKSGWDARTGKKI
jgi:type VI secretion system secreted protein Hcp